MWVQCALYGMDNFFGYIHWSHVKIELTDYSWHDSPTHNFLLCSFGVANTVGAKVPSNDDVKRQILVYVDDFKQV